MQHRVFASVCALGGGDKGGVGLPEVTFRVMHLGVFRGGLPGLWLWGEEARVGRIIDSPGRRFRDGRRGKGLADLEHRRLFFQRADLFCVCGCSCFKHLP